MTNRTEVATADGVVRGRKGRDTVQWRSIPYAAPPVGDLRLRAPQPVRPWPGVRDATRFGPAAVQRRNPMLGLRSTDEDCLTLNVTAPAHPADRPRPVLVYLHGGGYVSDTSARYPGDSLALRGDVVVVTVNYRLGALGYLDFTEFGTADRVFEANLGLRDQLAALGWVQRTIAAFGGDPTNVTVFGESAGGHAVLALLASPAAAGLVHRVIAQSPAADRCVHPEEARRFARRLLDVLGATPESAAEALRTASALDLCRAGDQALAQVQRECPGSYPMTTVVDGDVLPLEPLAAIRSGAAHRLPLIVGTNRDECTLHQFDPGQPTTGAALRAALARSGADHDRIAAAYPGYPKRAAAIRVSTDFLYWRPVLTALEGHCQHAPTFGYRYDFAPRALNLAGLGAIHGLELLSLFGGADGTAGQLLTLAGGRSGLRAVRDELQDNWLAFARTGRPLPSWPEYTVQERKTRIIDHPSRVQADPERTRRLIWSDVRIPAPA